MRITKQDFAQVPGKICIEMLDLSLQDLSDDIVAVTAFFHIHLPIPESILSQETARLTLIFRHEGVDWKIAYSGISIPYGLAHDNEIYPMTRLEERNLELERIIATRTAELAEINKNLEILSNTDGLTGIANRRHFDHMLIQEWNRCQRANTPLSLIMLDIDHFKQFNDLYGHLTGDDCLKTLAHALSQVGRRAGELAARYGGEEFVILLPNMDKQVAQETAQNVEQIAAVIRTATDDARKSYRFSQQVSLNSEEAKMLASQFRVTYESTLDSLVHNEVVRWSDAFRVGIAEVDNQHLGLFNSMNKLYHGIINEMAPEQVQTCLNELVLLAKKHLEDEESLMLRANYSDLNAHKQVHVKLLSDMDNLLRRFANKEAGSDMELLFFLKNWLVDHIFRVDKRYVPELKAAGM